VAGQWFSPGTTVSCTNKTDCHDVTEILLKVALNTITPRPNPYYSLFKIFIESVQKELKICYIYIYKINRSSDVDLYPF
jgi:hypothetical protein